MPKCGLFSYMEATNGRPIAAALLWQPKNPVMRIWWSSLKKYLSKYHESIIKVTIMKNIIMKANVISDIFTCKPLLKALLNVVKTMKVRHNSTNFANLTLFSVTIGCNHSNFLTMIWAMIIGRMLLTQSFKTTSEKKSCLLYFPRYKKIKPGVTMTPMALLKVELNMQQTTLPPEALVKITATFIVIGRQETMMIPFANSLLKFIRSEVSSVQRPNTALETKKKLKHCKNMLNFTFVRASFNSFKLRFSPCTKNMIITAIQEAVIFGANLFSAIGGSIVAIAIAHAMLISSEYFK